MLNSVVSCCGGFTGSVLCGFAVGVDHLVCHLLLWRNCISCKYMVHTFLVLMSVQKQGGSLDT